MFQPLYERFILSIPWIRRHRQALVLAYAIENLAWHLDGNNLRAPAQAPGDLIATLETTRHLLESAVQRAREACLAPVVAVPVVDFESSPDATVVAPPATDIGRVEDEGPGAMPAPALTEEHGSAADPIPPIQSITAYGPGAMPGDPVLPLLVELPLQEPAPPEVPPLPTVPAMAPDPSAVEPGPLAKELIRLRDQMLLVQSGGQTPTPAVLQALYRKMGQALAREGLVTLEEDGPFDYNRQEVVATCSTHDPAQDDRVSDTVRPGYLYQGQLYRPQEVVIYKYEPATS